jgi:hypothetical protein
MFGGDELKEMIDSHLLKATGDESAQKFSYFL